MIEGYRELLRASDAKRKIDELFICPEFFLGTNEDLLIEKFQNEKVAVYRVSQELFSKLSYRDRPDGLLGVATQYHLRLSDIKLKDAPFLVVAESIEKPGNLGTILRSMDAVGADALIVSDPLTDIHNPNVVRASVGTLFTVPVIEAKGDATLLWLKQNKIQLLAATPSAEVEYTQVNLKGPIAIAVGTEQYGLSASWLDASDIKVRIPMRGVADSLNVGAATTVLLYEVLRQRSA